MQGRDRGLHKAVICDIFDPIAEWFYLTNNGGLTYIIGYLDAYARKTNWLSSLSPSKVADEGTKILIQNQKLYLIDFRLNVFGLCA